MPLGKKKTKIINEVINNRFALLKLWQARCKVSEHNRTTIQEKQIEWILEAFKTVSETIND